MANLDVIDALNEIARQKNLSREFVIETLKQGLLQACKKKFGTADNITVDVEDDSGEIGIFARRTVVETVEDPALQINPADAADYIDRPKPGDEVDVIIPFEEFGRLAIQQTKQILFQRVREAEREQVFQDFSTQLGEIITGTVQQINRGDILVNLGRTEAVLPFREQIRSERYQQGRTVRACVIDVVKTIKGPQVILSRSHPDFLRKLFAQEVPEIRDGLVEIKAVARDAGERAKVAVYTKDPKIDAVGACVGVKGVRVQAVVRELSGEKIDIIFWSPDPATFVVRALSPAKDLEAFADEAEQKMLVICPDLMNSKAIGKRGENVRLASKLTGWRINVINETEYQSRLAAVESQLTLDELDVSDKVKAKLAEAGLETLTKVIEAGQEKLTELPGIGDKTAERILSQAIEIKDGRLMKLLDQPREKPKDAEGGDEQPAAAPAEEAAPPAVPVAEEGAEPIGPDAEEKVAGEDPAPEEDETPGDVAEGGDGDSEK
ncbi:MAG: transcription termination factor NusA [Candidatus Edwardsbacteria bacterium]|nr:transcription termination factor NusA [Candidatus Edwardsbacteria bacterium]